MDTLNIKPENSKPSFNVEEDYKIYIKAIQINKDKERCKAMQEYAADKFTKIKEELETIKILLNFSI